MTLLLLASSAACGPLAPAPGDGGDDATSDVAERDLSADVPLAPPYDSGDSCLAPGSGEIRVMLQLPTSVDLSRAEIWVAAMCLTSDGERAVRVVRADPHNSGTVTLAGLGPGRYVVRASTLVVPSAMSAPLSVSPGGMAVTPLAIVPGDGPIAQARAAPDAGLVDSGHPSGYDAGSSGYLCTTTITRAGRAEPVGSLDLEADPRDTDSFDVRATARSYPCTSGCLRLTVRSVEVRVARGGEPAGFALLPFATQGGSALLGPGDAVVTMSRTIGAPLDDPNISFAVALWGNVADPDAGVTADAGVRPSDGGARD